VDFGRKSHSIESKCTKTEVALISAELDSLRTDIDGFATYMLNREVNLGYATGDRKTSADHLHAPFRLMSADI
jgi:hypothetical protein